MKFHQVALTAAASLLLGASSAAADDAVAKADRLDPYAVVVGGVSMETLQARDEDDSEGRGTTIALSRLGVRGQLRGGVYVESEFEVNGGPHGTSVWEGQAALQVRNQLVRIQRGRIRVDAGRITDDASLDFHSAHVADQLLTDAFTRAPLLASGFNRGNGVLFRYGDPEGLRAGFTLNAANPTSTTASLVVGGTFPPFSRFYFAPYQHVGRDASSLPADTYHIAIFTPAVLYSHPGFDVHTSVQMFRVNTNTASDADENIIGYNLRAGVRFKLVPEGVYPFLNASRVVNSVVDPEDGAVLSTERFEGVTVSLGVDYNFLPQAGVGVHYSLVREAQQMTYRNTEHYLNVGGTYWLTDTTSIGSRLSIFTRCTESPGEECEREGVRSYFATLRTLL
jgi:opacity protein-like surface antigen